MRIVDTFYSVCQVRHDMHRYCICLVCISEDEDLSSVTIKQKDLVEASTLHDIHLGTVLHIENTGLLQETSPNDQRQVVVQGMNVCKNEQFYVRQKSNTQKCWYETCTFFHGYFQCIQFLLKLLLQNKTSLAIMIPFMLNKHNQNVS